jgi:cation:H+ antiporter
MAVPLAAAVFVAAAALSLGASAVLVARLERLGTRLGVSEALLGLVAALAADTPEVTAAVIALAHGQHDIGAGVVLGSNVFNLAALIGLGAVVAGGIRLHRRVVIFEGTVALWMAAVAIAAAISLIPPVTALALALAVLTPYVYVSAVHPSGRSALALPPRLRSWLAGAVAEEEQELSEAIHPGHSSPRDATAAVLALAVVLAASAALERSATALGARYAVPGVITGAIVLAAVTSLPNAVAAIFLARRGRASATLSEAFNSNTLNVLAGLLIPAVIIASPDLGSATRIAIWYGLLTAATIALALAGRGINRRSGALIIAAYLVFAITVIAKATPPAASGGVMRTAQLAPPAFAKLRPTGSAETIRSSDPAGVAVTPAWASADMACATAVVRMVKLLPDAVVIRSDTVVSATRRPWPITTR